MWAAGQAGLSNIVNKTIIIQRALKEDHINLQVQDIIVTPPGKKWLNEKGPERD